MTGRRRPLRVYGLTVIMAVPLLVAALFGYGAVQAADAHPSTGQTVAPVQTGGPPP